VTNRDGPSAIYVMNADGSQPVNLISMPGEFLKPDWSPDGSRIAFTSNRDGRNEIYVMNANGGFPTRLTNHPAGSGYATWSPDGTRLAFESSRDGNPEIYAMNADGSTVIRLTDNSAYDGSAAWSPDGEHIAFSSDRDGVAEIYVMNADGSQPFRLTNTTKNQYWPSWSPDGTRIAFGSYRDGNWEIYVTNADGSQPTRLTRTTTRDMVPTWSPDGTRIYFASDRDGTLQIYAMKPDGSEQIRITINTALEWWPACQPREPSAEAIKTPPSSVNALATLWLPTATLRPPTATVTPTLTAAATTPPPKATITATRTAVPQTPLPEGVLSQAVNISGIWDSDFGQVTMALWQSQDSRLFPVTGSWIQKDGNKGIIESGTFDPKSRVLEFSYYQPWNKIEGSARFDLSADGKTLKGTYKEASGQGGWNMQRSAVVSPPTATPSIPPGIYVTNLRTDPAVLGPSMDAGFFVTFLNTTNTAQQYRWNVYVFRTDNPKNSFGEASDQVTSIPVGTGEQQALGSWRIGAGTCGSYFARVARLDEAKNRTYLTKPDGNVYELWFNVCQ